MVGNLAPRRACQTILEGGFLFTPVAELVMVSVSRHSSHLRSLAVARRTAAVASFAIAASLAAAPAAAQLTRSLPASLTDREFWDFFTTMSEEGGSFPSENFVSNEQTYQHVIPTLKRTVTPGGVYLGVGPEQNFTYITNLKPQMAVIFDIRRQNAMAHLMYKALFEMSPTRAEFVSHLFSRPMPTSLGPSSSAKELFIAAFAAKMSDSAFENNRKTILELLTLKHGFALTEADVQSVKHVYASFFEAGPEINYGYRFGGMRGFGPPYSTYAEIQTLTNAEGVNMAFLATEENYQWLRALHEKNLVVPVVGDFAGPKAIRSVGEYFKQRRATVSAFYLSNVEQYLFRGAGDAERFYRNVEALPVDSNSRFIRSVPPDNGGLGGSFTFMSGGGSAITSNGYISVSVRDSAGVNVVRTTTDSAGTLVTKETIDSSRTRRPTPLELFRALRARDDSLFRARADSANRLAARDSTVFGRSPFRSDSMFSFGGARSIVVGNAGTLVSGLAPIRATLEAFNAGKLQSYPQAIAMTKIDGWK